MVKVAIAPLDVDLLPFVQYLRAKGVDHRVLETETGQEVWLKNAEDADFVQTSFTQWAKGEPLENDNASASSGELTRSTTTDWRAQINGRYLSLALIIVSLVLSLYTDFGALTEQFGLFTITDIFMHDGSFYTKTLANSFESGEIWRLITPIFLHLSISHLVFNLLWVWVVGGRIESTLGVVWFGLLVLFTAVVSNVAQFYQDGPLFGGMSGVVYGLFGFAFLWQKWHPSMYLGINNGLMAFMLVWLALGYTGVPESLGLGVLNNTAHLIGLMSGGLFAFILFVAFKVRRTT